MPIATLIAPSKWRAEFKTTIVPRMQSPRGVFDLSIPAADKHRRALFLGIQQLDSDSYLREKGVNDGIRHY